MTKSWWMCNVVLYDGCDAFVSKFILNCTEDKDCHTILTEESEGLLGQYCMGNGEILKVDILYPMSFENIAALENYKDSRLENEIEQYAAYDRFIHMYF